MPEVKHPSMMQVVLNVDQISILIGLTFSYSRQYLDNLYNQMKKAPTQQMASITSEIAHFTQASGVLSKALSDMLTEGEGRITMGDSSPFAVLFTEHEHAHILNLLNTSNFQNDKAQNFSQATVDKMTKLIEDTRIRFNAAKKITPEEYKQITDANMLAKDIATEIPNGFFPQFKVGSA